MFHFRMRMVQLDWSILIWGLKNISYGSSSCFDIFGFSQITLDHTLCFVYSQL